ncbi:hypothetical protein [Paraburkholderia unamae]|uniref:Transmembrane protein n=1 Tax=Paraburkholderia unamae TaxID=219649 RepID=A0ABX5KIZ2_9BURK|nr:hypothetical protein [Paraburkholderia unamae]PVX81394.1 hypothetical protein C7402_111296 [Paraburkholderia unamae]RAR54644.1 hypothetical protein C7401_124141 [Paraburkholderia unamae]
MEESDRPKAGYAEARAADQSYGHVRAAVSWSAIVAGAVGMAAFSLILLTLGTGLGLSSLSPWPGSGTHAKTFGVAAIIWICVTQVLAAGLGGYLAGRLRRHWPSIGTDETHFRDTAHGFLAWALATLLSAAFLTSAISGLAGEGVSAGVQSASRRTNETGGLVNRGNALSAYASWPMGYLIDGMLRPAAGATESNTQSQDQFFATAAQKQEIARIFLNSLPAGGPLSPEDSDYVARIVVQRTGLAPADAHARVATTWARLEEHASAEENAARATVEAARKATVHVTLWLFISLLMGAFVASLMATVGGRMREL